MTLWKSRCHDFHLPNSHCNTASFTVAVNHRASLSSVIASPAHLLCDILVHHSAGFHPAYLRQHLAVLPLPFSGY